MMANEHERARELSLAGRVDEIGAAERRWLESHLQGCEPCSEFAATLDAAVSSVRMPAVTASSALVQATTRRVRARALELQTREAAMRPLWVAVALVAAWATLTTGALWAGFVWLGTTYRLATMEWGVAFFFAWMAPTLAASIFLMGADSHADRIRTALVRAREAL